MIQKLIFDTWSRKKQSEENSWSQGLYVGMSPGEAISKESDTFLSMCFMKNQILFSDNHWMGTNQSGIPEINIENKFKISFALCSHSKQAAQAHHWKGGVFLRSAVSSLSSHALIKMSVSVLPPLLLVYAPELHQPWCDNYIFIM